MCARFSAEFRVGELAHAFTIDDPETSDWTSRHDGIQEHTDPALD
jgi:hypothetical protein